MTEHNIAPLYHYLQQPQGLTLWFADENMASTITQIPPNKYVKIITNRYDIFVAGEQHGHRILFSDFLMEDYNNCLYSRIVYRISKEKALTHHLINQAVELLDSDGTLILAGEKQNGIKSYADKLKKRLKAQGILKKQGDFYIGEFTKPSKSEQLDDQNYSLLQKVSATSNTTPYFYSKPGVFGWNKIDQGTQLLLQSIESIAKNMDTKECSALDLGCGYGWIFMNIDHYGFKNITATDNNAAAIIAAKKNSLMMKTPIDIIASDCASTIDKKFDIVICNPPFHQGFDHKKNITENFIKNSWQRLSKKGKAIFVVNNFIDIKKHAKKYQLEHTSVEKNKSFHVILLEKNK